MRNILDANRPDGAEVVEISFGPLREAFAVESVDALLAIAEHECQVWGGAGSVFVPLIGGVVPDMYASALRGSDVHHLSGLEGKLQRAGALVVKPTVEPISSFGRQFAPAVLPSGRQDDYLPVRLTQLRTDDPWKAIYAVCLGSLSEAPPAELLRETYLRADLRIDDFLRIETEDVTGGVRDLMERARDRNGHLSPRRMSNLTLAQRPAVTAFKNRADSDRPSAWRSVRQAGQSIVVVCGADEVSDLALAWNLRAAHGDYAGLPIGVPDSANLVDDLQAVLDHRETRLLGGPDRGLTITSASIAAETLASRLAALNGEYRVVPPEEVLSLGFAPAWRREEVLVWREGKTSLMPLPSYVRQDLLSNSSINPMAHMTCEIRVPALPFPASYDSRAEGMNWTFRAGAAARWSSMDSRTEVQSATWPAPITMAAVVGAWRGLKQRESEPGKACRLILSGLGDIGELSYLMHEPLLKLLEEIAARHGLGWYKSRLRGLGQGPAEAEAANGATPPTVEDLPERTFHHFKSALGNSEAATKNWLVWAERVGLVVKGFSVKCDNCEGKQWVPVAGFRAPLVCHGCGLTIGMPFGERSTVDFRYRISERMRRVYENDAIGHLLTLAYLDALFRGIRETESVGLHPGLEYLTNEGSVVGEADVLALLTDGSLIPFEVKRSAIGMSSGELAKLDALCEALGSPWSGVAVGQYARDVDGDLEALAVSNDGTPHSRRVLTYDHLLEVAPVFPYTGDPFASREMTPDEIKERETRFVQMLAQSSAWDASDWDARFLISDALKAQSVE